MLCCRSHGPRPYAHGRGFPRHARRAPSRLYAPTSPLQRPPAAVAAGEPRVHHVARGEQLLGAAAHAERRTRVVMNSDVRRVCADKGPSSSDCRAKCDRQCACDAPAPQVATPAPYRPAPGAERATPGPPPGHPQPLRGPSGSYCDTPTLRTRDATCVQQKEQNSVDIVFIFFCQTVTTRFFFLLLLFLYSFLRFPCCHY
ncbi:hypothetical protein FOCC_FOCC005146 [Frankliniella occidentalis]|nr:hypothetical protein FOCC_FOCC005146 [Frankliniella occidentalis]